jgi:hypothetical protein
LLLFLFLFYLFFYSFVCVCVCAAGGDSIDSSILALFLLAERSGKEFWAFMQGHPNHFSVSGLFYLQAQRDVGLEPGKHLTFPWLPGKV